MDDRITKYNTYIEKFETCSSIQTEFGILEKKYTKDQRYYYVHTPNHLSSNDVIFFLHGSKADALDKAINGTEWIKKDAIIIFPESSGKKEQPSVHPHYGGLTFGEKYWEIRDYDEQFLKDINYIKEIADLYESQNKYLIGHSNGGVFACLVPLFLPSIFKKVCSHMGGIGYDLAFYLNFEKSNGIKTPMLFYSGENDVHLNPCIAAKNIFESEGFEVKLIVIPGLKHFYVKEECKKIMHNWFIN